MYKCLVADDQMIERDHMVLQLSKIRDIKIVAECKDGNEAADVIKNQHIDIVFSDIMMPGLNGLALLKSLKNPPVFVFISSYSDFAVESFELDVVDYIIKPVTFERLFKATTKAIEYISLKQKVAYPNGEMINEPGLKLADDKHIFIKDALGYTKIEIADILYVESMGDFSKLHTVQNKKFVVLVNLKSVEKQLPGNIFRRVHKQFVINTSHIITLGANDVILSDERSIPVSTAYRQEILDSVVKKTLLKR